MRSRLIGFIFLLIPFLSGAQQDITDSLRKIFSTTRDDSARYESAIHLYDYYEELNRDSAFFYADQCVTISSRNNKKLNQAYSLSRKAYQEVTLGRYAESLHSLLDAFSISENPDNDKYYWMIDPLKNEKQKRFFSNYK